MILCPLSTARNALEFFKTGARAVLAAQPSEKHSKSEPHYLQSSKQHLLTSIPRGHDIHVAVDANFSHRHLSGSGNCPMFFQPQYFIPKAEVDAAGHRIDLVKGKDPKEAPVVVPDEAIDSCEKSHQAGNGTNVKTHLKHFDDGGIAALVCRHGIPLFLTNIDTPGEQQKYAVAMLDRLYSLIPSNASVSVFYDVGCVLDRSCRLVSLI